MMMAACCAARKIVAREERTHTVAQNLKSRWTKFWNRVCDKDLTSACLISRSVIDNEEVYLLEAGEIGFVIPPAKMRLRG